MNKITRDLKQGIVDAAIKHGSNGKGAGGLGGFFQYMIKNDLRAFASLMGRVIPLQVNATPGAFIGAVNIVGVPAGQYLSEEQVKAMMPDLEQPKVIDISSRAMVIDEEPVDVEAEDVA
ncbi:hypothetical protein JQ543_13695 [Bradyrhizobium diazoefficiens]|nr:hypothetical protein [Bradyrhizobium diazoefficiens]MBR0848801.1 hypothetical protein [Bradyrhizobium diazoefficiens]